MPESDIVHRAKKVEKPGHVVGVVFQRMTHRIADRLVGSKVDNDIEGVAPNDGSKRISISEVQAVEREVAAPQMSDPVHDRFRAVYQAIDYDDVISVIKQVTATVAADETGAAGYENCRIPHVRHPIRPA